MLDKSCNAYPFIKHKHMNVNSVTLIGYVTNNPESKEFGEGGKLAKFGLATNSRSKDKEKRTPEYHNVVAFGPLAKICAEYVSKGRLVYIRGRLKTRKWEDDNQNLRTRTEVIADDMLLLDKKKASVSAVDETGASEAAVQFATGLTPVAQTASVQA
jgi:single-strand DNA-binding protein